MTRNAGCMYCFFMIPILLGEGMNEKKYAVLIVDDEYRIAMLISKLIHWEEMGLECAGVVDNSIIALETVQKEKIDIMITDIRMPQMDGMELIEKALNTNPDLKVIVISGYKEFEYAQKAIQFGVGSYLVKPINENALNESLKKIVQQCEKENETIHLKNTLSKSERIIKSNLLKDIIELDSVPKDTGEILKNGIYRGMDIKLDRDPSVEVNPVSEKQIVNKIISIVESKLLDIADSVLLCEKKDMHIYCLFSYQKENMPDLRDALGGVLLEIQKYLIESGAFVVTIGVGNEQSGIGDIRYSIKGAYRAVCNRIRLGTGRMIYEENIPPYEAEDIRITACVEEIRAIHASYSEERLTALINNLFEKYLQENEMDYSACYKLAEMLTEKFFDEFEEDKTESKRLILEKIQNSNSILKLKKMLKTELCEELKRSRAALESESVKPVRQAKQYIEEHYNEKIVLEDIAELVGLNPVYFSVLFKKETEMNFSAYLLQVRMSKAAEMICSTNETIAAIAEQVGYKDSRYFSQCFEKAMGVKPALYRRLHS